MKYDSSIKEQTELSIAKISNLEHRMINDRNTQTTFNNKTN